jgi:hypothetical protein
MANAADEQRMRALEAQNAELRQRLDALQAKVSPRPKPPAPIPEDDGFHVSFPRSAPIEMPSIAQFERLLIIVGRAYPKIVPTFDREGDRMEFFNGFCASFERIANLRRTVGEGGAQMLNKRNDARHWASEAYSWLQQRGTPAETMNGSFFAAVIAAGDVPFSLADRVGGVPAYVGLGYEGLTASTVAWRRVLASGQPREAIGKPSPLPDNQRVEVRYSQ